MDPAAYKQLKSSNKSKENDTREPLHYSPFDQSDVDWVNSINMPHMPASVDPVVYTLVCAQSIWLLILV